MIIAGGKLNWDTKKKLKIKMLFSNLNLVDILNWLICMDFFLIII